jgi:hypothetical protein
MFKLFFLFILPMLSILSCNTTNPPQSAQEPKLSLLVEDVSCVGAWINLKTENISFPAYTIIYKDNNILEELSIMSSDSTIYIDSLLPNKSYSIKVSIEQGNKYYPSNSIAATTMDTTSHDFTWQKFEFGDYTSNSLFDVAIIDENNIWAGGQIYLFDSTGQRDPQPYNAVHWNGKEWEILRIPTRNFFGTISFAQISTIFAFNKDDIWTFSDAGSYSHWDGKTWTTEFLLQRKGGGTKFWGTSASDLYLACSSGGISHFDGTNWTLLNAGTNLNINDIYGAWNNRTNQFDIMAVASNLFESLDRNILQISRNIVSKENTYNLNGTLYTTWFKSNKQYYVAGDGIYQKNQFSEDVWKNKTYDITTYYIYSIRGNDINDIIAVGGFGEMLHFNGIRWKSFMNETGINGNLYSVNIEDNLVVAVGYGSTKGVIFIGQR